MLLSTKDGPVNQEGAGSPDNSADGEGKSERGCQGVDESAFRSLCNTVTRGFGGGLGFPVQDFG